MEDFTKKLKATAAKTWEYAKQYRDLKRQLVSSWVVPMIKQKIDIVYSGGLIILGVCALVIILKSFTDPLALLFTLLCVAAAFIVFRTLCEIVAVCPIDIKKPVKAVPAAAPKAEKKAEAKKAEAKKAEVKKAEVKKEEAKKAEVKKVAKPTKKKRKSAKKKAKKPKA